MKKVKIAIADDHQLIIDGLKAIFETSENFDVVLEANDGDELISKLDKVRPDLILADLEMPLKNGLEVIQITKAKYPGIKIIALTMYNEPALVKECIKAGASGFILKNIVKKELFKAIELVISGGTYFSENIFEHSSPLKGYLNKNEEIAILNNLTKREKEILLLLAEGMSLNEIAEKFFISPRTVDTHRTNIMKKVSVNNSAGMIRFAYKSGLIT